MIDVEQQVRYWREGAQEDWEVARHLIERGNVRHGLFFVHLALEKALKALVVLRTQNLAPRIRNLLRLRELAGLMLSEEQLDLVADANPLNLEGRYPDLPLVVSSKREARAFLARSKELLDWLNEQS